MPEGLLKLETYLHGNNGKFFVGDSFTWAELHFQQFIDLVIGMTDNNQVLDATPNLKDLNSRICAVPAVAKWIETRPRTPFNCIMYVKLTSPYLVTIICEDKHKNNIFLQPYYLNRPKNLF